MKVFDDYVKRFNLEEYNINLKYEHSYRVRDIAVRIGKSLNLVDDIKLISICGLFHDIGRFEQYTKFKTYDDLSSVDHADLGCSIIENEFRETLYLNDEDFKLLCVSTKEHNKINLRKGLSEREELISKIIRDSDKIDIISLFGDRFNFNNLLDDNFAVTKECEDDFFNHQQIDKRFVKTSGDKLLLYLGFIWDINFEESLRILKENDYFRNIQKLVDDSSFDKYFDVIYNKLKEV